MHKHETISNNQIIDLGVLNESKIKDFTNKHFLKYYSWFDHESISSTLGYIDQEWLDFVLGTEGFKQFSFVDNEKLIAVCGIYLPISDFDYYAILDFAVNPDYHNMGYGSKFLNEIIYNYYFNDSNCWKAIISLENITAIKFFKYNGWQFEEIQDNEYSKYSYLKNK
ncbi:GNAT family N-acetyltransferase [Acinetobacter sp.]|jgi:ribosomal protein S18 acetylase RimI-like enzyme|uniref:GNAT family N-acetyltransferase n=1 Tax=Acinetobacter sp. TaxID=472 RepID=UPI002827D404|nr:GNAT family N-acetyltransferase [Acinetobacter sp.]MDR2248599.1 GNAT family N-acetyltransferase [Acinetobacter sp.]